MRRLTRAIAPLLLILHAAIPTLADDVSGAQKVLCAPIEITECWADGECLEVEPWDVNVPPFLVLDFEDREIRTTEASDEKRQSELRNLTRENGRIVAQGVQEDRVFSFVISERSGFLTAAIATDAVTLSIFGTCTPQDSK